MRRAATDACTCNQPLTESEDDDRRDNRRDCDLFARHAIRPDQRENRLGDLNLA